MSYLTIKNFIDAGRKSLNEKNYWSALSVALALPGMCSRLHFADSKYCAESKNILSEDESKYYRKKQDGTICWSDARCYEDFCKFVMRCDTSTVKDAPDSFLVGVLGDKFYEVLYALRCDIIHAGTINIYDDKKKIYLRIGETTGSTTFSKYRMVSVKSLCDTIFGYIETWLSNYNMFNNLTYTRVFDLEHNSDDVLLYNRLCEREHADSLEEAFNAENNQ